MKKYSREAVEGLSADLQEVIQETTFDRLSRLLYSTDASIYQIPPVGIAWPKNTVEVREAVRLAGQYGIPILPRGAGSSLAGQAINQALILDFSRHMDAVLDFNQAERTVTVEPGVVLGQLNRQLAGEGLTFGPDPASADRATVGGVIGNNATGAHSILHGMTHNHLLKAELILADGIRTTLEEVPSQSSGPGDQTGNREAALHRALQEIIDTHRKAIRQRFPRTFRNVAGYNLKALLDQERFNPAVLLAGSEGTLGVLTAATLNLVPIPAHTHLYLVHFQELGGALQSVPEILETDPSAVELIDRMLLDLARSNPAFQHLVSPIEGHPAAVLVVEYQGDHPRETAGKEVILSRLGPTVSLPDKKRQEQIWKARKVGLGILQSTRGDSKPTTFIEDAAVPVEHLADYALEIKRYAGEIGVGGIAFYAHASAGCLHIRPMVNLKREEGIRQMRQLAERSLALVIEYGGTTSGEHGEGIARGEFMSRLYGEELTRAFRKVKEAFDPDYLFNPGKIIDPPPMDSLALLRYGPGYTANLSPENTLLDFREEHGFDGAVEMCNGAGVCRQLEEGVMCPSFQATRDEKHSTRGRANALRAAMTGKLGPAGMTSAELYDVLDLCLSCQACLHECPSTVDMSKLKAEFLHQYYQEHGIPLRSRFFASIGQVSKLSQAFAPLVNFFLQPPTSRLLSLAGIHPDRPLPRFARERFTSWYQKQAPTAARHENGRVLFFHDTYMEYNYPHIGRAAVNILQKAGVNVIVLPEKMDSGRPAFSKGLLKKARRLAEYNLELLAPYAREGIPIVGCEPSVMVMLIKEYPDLVPGAEAELVARAVLPLEEYLVRRMHAGEISFTFDSQPRTVLYHGHCQQKANFGTTATRQLLELIPNCQITETDAGCCGMAGAFGYEKEHYSVSVEIAELALAPQVRGADPDTIICASGTSCREQIQHTAARKAVHPLEVFSQALL